jgi:sortase (surface protein transpeptidase)
VLVGVLGQDPVPPTTVVAPTISTPWTASPSGAATPPPTASSPGPEATELSVALPESEPVRLAIPSIGVDSAFVELGLSDDSELETPTNAGDVGWFTGGHTPGARGVAVVAGHVTYNGPAVFFRLADLAAGDPIEITRSDGSTAIFAARRSATFPKTEFPSAEVYRPSDSAELVLITCGGQYADAHYDSNVIVWAELIDVRD